MARVFSSADRVLAARLETAEAANGINMARALASYLPEACFEPFGGGVGIFAGVGSSMTHVIGLGLSGSRVMPAEWSAWRLSTVNDIARARLTSVPWLTPQCWSL